MTDDLTEATRTSADGPGSRHRAAGDSPPPPKHIDRYRVERVLGRGAFGCVYLAYDEQLERRVTIKVPHAKLIRETSDIEAYLAEARTVAGLDHPGIVPVHDVGSTTDVPCYVVSKYVEGTDLATKLKQQRYGCREAVELVATIAEALHYAHRQRLVHRDVKPANILIGNDGRPYVLDFGLALREENIGKGPKYAGTPAYMSPEQARGEGHRVDGRSDIYSLGAVFYELLTGRRTFAGETKLEILEQIAGQEPRPPRQISDGIPRELERVCLKALARRASERYTTSIDMAEDLRLFLTEHPTMPAVSSGMSVMVQPDAESTRVIESGTLQSSSQLVRIVPKGLRSFDAHDSDFFLELLPGPRDREGLPDSLRFWKTRIEETDPDNTFPVGLIYGPSGCGKSSLVRAGLVPRLAPEIVPIYVEATAGDTESRLTHRLRKRVPGLPEDLTLKQTIAELRRGRGLGEGQKVLIILDQFEQWLHANREREDTELSQALRQCDGARVQCLLMVRDDFWMAVTRFLGELEVELVQGYNFAPVDLFPVRHARTVLAAFGRAFGALPEGKGKPQREQREFLTQAVESLSRDGKVVCVRLALFAEMMKSRLWTPATLREVGGATGLGVTFLEETFGSSAASPSVRLHQKAARAILTALLPDSGTHIKGHMKSSAELTEVSGYTGRPRDFDDVIRILDSEIRLITPTDPAGLDEDDGPAEPLDTGGRYYQLAHDYLVTPLRDWLTQRQKATRRGRATLRLAERASLWNARPERRHLPAWWEYTLIRLYTDKRDWTPPQRQMMSQAARTHGIRWGTGLLLVLLAAFLVHRTQQASRQRILEERTETAVAAMSTAQGVLIPHAIRDLRKLPRDMVVAALQDRFDDSDETQRFPLACALAHYEAAPVEFLVSHVKDASPKDVDNLVTALSMASTSSVAQLETAAEAARAARNHRLGARLTLLLLRLNSPTLAQTVCAVSADPVERAWFIEECSVWHGDLPELAAAITELDDSGVRSSLALVIGSVPPAERQSVDTQAWSPLLTDWFSRDNDALTHSAAAWALWQCEMPCPDVGPTRQPASGILWHVNGVGMTMVQIPAGSYVPGPADPPDNATPVEANADGPVSVEAFLLSDREITRKLFQQFIADPDTVVEKPAEWAGVDEQVSPTDDHPVQQVSWYEAVLFCNWLSRREGLVPCYERTGADENIRGTSYAAWRLVEGATGYRLPTEEEWEHACRAGTVTTFGFGEDESLLDRYGVYRAERTDIVGSRLPNHYGLFDMHGNVREWCQNPYFRPGKEPGSTDSQRRSKAAPNRGIRGGAYANLASVARSSQATNSNPANKYSGNGFRVARTLP